MILKEASRQNRAENHMNYDPKSLDEIASAVKQDLNEKVDQWIKAFAQDISDLSTFPSISQIETSLLNLDNETRKIYLDMISDCLSNIDEKEVISSKKPNSDKRG